MKRKRQTKGQSVNGVFYYRELVHCNRYLILNLKYVYLILCSDKVLLYRLIVIVGFNENNCCFVLNLTIRYGTLERTSCVVHTLQLVINMVKKEQAIKRLLDKVRHLVRQFFPKSSVATERLLEQCGLILIKDCETRWSSSFFDVVSYTRSKGPHDIGG